MLSVKLLNLLEIELQLSFGCTRYVAEQSEGVWWHGMQPTETEQYSVPKAES